MKVLLSSIWLLTAIICSTEAFCQTKADMTLTPQTRKVEQKASRAQYLLQRKEKIAAYKADLENRLQQLRQSPDRDTPKMQQTEKVLQDELILLETKIKQWETYMQNPAKSDSTFYNAKKQRN